MRNLATWIVVLWVSDTCSMLTAQALKLPEGPGKATTQKVCGGCHGAEIVIGRQETQPAWGQIVSEMVDRGATGTDDEFYEVVDYLSKYFSPTSPVIKINVNKVTAKDLEVALALKPKQAADIVHYREEKGDFKSLDDLKKVPGLDARKLDANKNRLAF
jgi:competence protein ComEA